MNTPSALHTGVLAQRNGDDAGNMAAAHAEKSTVTAERMNAVSSGSESHNSHVGMSALDATAAVVCDAAAQHLTTQ